MKIVSTGATLSSPEYHKKKQRERKRKVTIYSSIAIAFLIALILLSRLDQIQISQVQAEGNKVISAEEIDAVVKETLSGHYLWIVPRTNTLLYPGNEIEERLLRKFPRFSSADVTLEGTNSIKVQVREREPFALYCESAERPEDASSCFFLDKDGYIFDEAPAFSGAVYFVYATDVPLENPKGQALIEKDEFGKLSRFIDDLDPLGFEPLAVEIRERDFTLIMPGQARLIWGRGDDFNEIYANLEAFLNNESIRKQGNFLEKFKELDLRTKNKVRWSLK